MTIQIGEKSLATTRAGDLDARLIEATGFSIVENAGVLGAGFTPSAYLARVLAPMLAESMALNELAGAIDAAGADGVRADVLALLTSAPEPAKGAKSNGGA